MWKKCENEPHEYISLIFIKQIPDSSCRLISKLKNLNKDMPHVHFKRETLKSVLSLIAPGYDFNGAETYLLLRCR